MYENLKIAIREIVQKSLEIKVDNKADIPAIELEIPANKLHGELSTNIALKSAKIFRKPPLVIAQEILELVSNLIDKTDLKEIISKIEVVAPGFINFHFSNKAFYPILEDVLRDGKNFGKTDIGEAKNLQIEFVSANPTGPLSVAHARQAAVGDALVNIFNFLGYNAKREFYVNDGGNQIRILGLSVQCRARQILGDDILFIEDGYQGDYIKDMAQEFIDNNKIDSLDKLNQVSFEEFREFGKNYLLDVIKEELTDFGVHFDIWSFESQVSGIDKIQQLIEDFRSKGLIYEKDGALWFESTKYGDDKDRVVRKSDGSYTYLTPDIVYHKNKFDRGFDRLINILGPDHHGYIPRLKAAVQALGKNKDDLDVLIVQLATIYRNGEKVSMSTRSGQYITLREVMNEVGVDAARFFYLMRHTSAHLDFDLDLAKKETSDNPVYYIQYAYARINSILQKAKEANIIPIKCGFSLLIEEQEIDLIKKMGQLKDTLVECHRQIDPFPLVNYLIELAGSFHRFYDAHKVLTDDDMLSQERTSLISATKTVLYDGLSLLGLSIPDKM